MYKKISPAEAVVFNFNEQLPFDEEPAELGGKTDRDGDGRGSGNFRDDLGSEISDESYVNYYPRWEDSFASSKNKQRANDTLEAWGIVDDVSIGVNAALRNSKGKAIEWGSGEFQSEIRDLDYVFSIGHTVAEDLTVYRAIGNSITGSFTDYGFTSTTTDKNIADKIAKQIGGKAYKVIIPKGIKIVAVPSNSSVREILINRGMTYSINGDTMRVSQSSELSRDDYRRDLLEFHLGGVSGHDPHTDGSPQSVHGGDEGSAPTIESLDEAMKYLRSKVVTNDDFEKSKYSDYLSNAYYSKENGVNLRLMQDLQVKKANLARELFLEKNPVNEFGVELTTDTTNALEFMSHDIPKSEYGNWPEKEERIRDSYVVNDARTLQSNMELRSGRKPTARESSINNLIRKGRATADTVVYRGAALEMDTINKMVSSGGFTDLAIMSTKPELGTGYLKARLESTWNSGSPTQPVIFKLKVPAGTKCADFGYGEVIFPFKTKVKITGVKFPTKKDYGEYGPDFLKPENAWVIFGELSNE